MKKDYKGNSKKGGIYRITNIKNNKIYIGSAKCFQVRASQHASSLRKQKHQNKHLQASFNKHGEDAFLFEVVEVIEGDRLARTIREEELLKEQVGLGNWDNCFNFQKSRNLVKEHVGQRTGMVFPRYINKKFLKRLKNSTKTILQEKKLWLRDC